MSKRKQQSTFSSEKKKSSSVLTVDATKLKEYIFNLQGQIDTLTKKCTEYEKQKDDVNSLVEVLENKYNNVEKEVLKYRNNNGLVELENQININKKLTLLIEEYKIDLDNKNDKIIKLQKNNDNMRKLYTECLSDKRKIEDKYIKCNIELESLLKEK
jgi:hypothetical protein